MPDLPSTELTISSRPADIDAEWLSNALRSGGHLGDAAVSAVATAAVGTGQMCDSVRVEVTYDGDAGHLPTSFVAKLPAADETSRGTAKALRSYEIEVRWYQQLAPSMPIRTPHVWYAAIDVDEADFVLLLEDLAPATQGDQLAGCSVAEAEAALTQLPALHAPRWGDPSLKDIEWLERGADAQKPFMAMMLPMWWSGFSERYADRLQPEALEVGAAIERDAEAYIHVDVMAPTIVHNDFRLDNLLFPGAGSPADAAVAVVDWQTLALGPGPFDAAYFIGAGLLAEDRRSSEDRLVRRYYDDLLARGVSDYTWDDCWREYRRATFGGFTMAVAASMLVEQTERGDDMFMAMAHRHAQHVLDVDALSLL